MRTATTLVETFSKRPPDPGTEATIERFQQFWEHGVKTGLFVEIVASGVCLDDDALDTLITNRPKRVCIGWEPDSDDDVLRFPLRCWLDDGHVWIESGVVSTDDEQAMRNRLLEYDRRAENGGLGKRTYPLMRRADGKRSFVVELL